ncbi:hypothetical protein T795_02688, partial [Staphylococcus aureus MISS6048]
KGVYFMNENLEKYIKSLPLLGLLISILFQLFYSFLF